MDLQRSLVSIHNHLDREQELDDREVQAIKIALQRVERAVADDIFCEIVGVEFLDSDEGRVASLGVAAGGFEVGVNAFGACIITRLDDEVGCAVESLSHEHIERLSENLAEFLDEILRKVDSFEAAVSRESLDRERRITRLGGNTA